MEAGEVAQVVVEVGVVWVFDDVTWGDLWPNDAERGGEWSIQGGWFGRIK
jgi:hypothetical protein